MTSFEIGPLVMFVCADGKLYTDVPGTDQPKEVSTFRVGNGIAMTVADLPGLKPGDLVTIESDDRRWRVVRLREFWPLRNRRHRKVIRQAAIHEKHRP